MNKIYLVTKRSINSQFDRSDVPICAFDIRADAKEFATACKNYREKHPLCANTWKAPPGGDPRSYAEKMIDWRNSHSGQIAIWEKNHPVRKHVKGCSVTENDEYDIILVDMIISSKGLGLTADEPADLFVPPSVDFELVNALVADDFVLKRGEGFDENPVSQVYGMMDRKVAEIYWNDKIHELMEKKSIVLYSVFKKFNEKGFEIRFTQV